MNDSLISEGIFLLLHIPFGAETIKADPFRESLGCTMQHVLQKGDIDPYSSYIVIKLLVKHGATPATRVYLHASVLHRYGFVILHE